LHGDERPKQFVALFANGGTLLDQTLDRAVALAPAHRVVVVGAAPHAAWLEAHLRPWRRRGVGLILQPRNAGTGAGVILGLAHVWRRAPSARVVVLPSDHYVASPDVFVGAVRAARDAARPVLLGAPAEAPETGYGWIVPGRDVAPRLRELARFVEKPVAPAARQLHRDGALWNTFVFGGRVAQLFELAMSRLPAVSRPLAEAAAAGPAALDRAYAEITSSDFSKDVLERSAGQLTVGMLGPCGWSDFGTPERVISGLTDTVHLDGLLRRIIAGQRGARCAA
jgi:mannose-1-phosphate guanylyltransferase